MTIIINHQFNERVFSSNIWVERRKSSNTFLAKPLKTKSMSSNLMDRLIYGYLSVDTTGGTLHPVH